MGKGQTKLEAWVAAAGHCCLRQGETCKAGLCMHGSIGRRKGLVIRPWTVGQREQNGWAAWMWIAWGVHEA